jgi:molybdopterin synthase sulfur carrier subunit
LPAIDILYFGQLRATLGRDAERVEPPSHVLTVDDLIEWLSTRGDPWRPALADRGNLCTAVDREHASLSDSIFGAQEVALFPPVRGL